MAEPEKVKYARQVVAQQMLADAVVGVKLLWEDYPLLSEGEFAVVEKLALQVAPPPWEQFEAAYDFLASLADDADEASRARGGALTVPKSSPTESQLVHGYSLQPAPLGASRERYKDRLIIEARSLIATVVQEAFAAEAEAERLASVPCRWEMDSWSYFRHGQTDRYWMQCKLVGPHKVHENSDTGATWTNDTEGAHEL